MSNELITAAKRDSDASTTLEGLGDGVIARMNGLVCRRVGGANVIARDGCTGRAVEASGLRVLRCERCRDKPEKARKAVKDYFETATKETAATNENIKFITQNPEKASNEIISLREQVKELRAKYESKGKAEEDADATDPKALIGQLMKLIDVEIQKEKQSRGERPITEREMWLIHTKHMLNVFLMNGNMRKVVQAAAQVDWSIVLHARTSNRVYNEISKVMKLPSLATIYRKGNEMISSSSNRAYSVCMKTFANISRIADEQGWSDNDRLIFFALDSANGVTGLDWDYTKKEMVGGCEEYRYQPLRNFFNSIADSQNDSNEEGVGSAGCVGSILDNIKLAQEHCVAKASGVSPDIKLSDVVASTDCNQFSAEVVKQMIHLLQQIAHNFKLYPMGVAYDAANPNLSAVKACATHAVGGFLPADLKASYPAIDFDGFKQISIDVVGNPYLCTSDIMHCCKALHTTLEKSSSPQSQRYLMYRGCPMTLKMVELVWRSTGGASNQVQHTKLSELTFNRGPKSRMDCSQTGYLFSNAAALMIQNAVDDDDIVLGTFKNKAVFRPLSWYLQHLNDLIDITNGKQGMYGRENGREIQIKLLKILDWFSKWKNDHDKRVAKPEDFPNMTKPRTEYNFLAPVTWDCLRNVILSHVFVIQYYCIGKGFKVHPRKLNTDPVEQHFGNCRQSVGGSTQGLTIKAWRHGDQKAGLAQRGVFGSVGNCKDRGEHFTKANKY